MLATQRILYMHGLTGMRVWHGFEPVSDPRRRGTVQPSLKAARKEIFLEILNAQDGDYVVQAQLLRAMKPEGW